MGQFGDGWRRPKIILAVRTANDAIDCGMFGVAAKQLNKAHAMINKTKLTPDVLRDLIFIYGYMAVDAQHDGAMRIAHHCEQMKHMLQSRFDNGDYYHF